eukprot:tig00020912_g15814.t1
MAKRRKTRLTHVTTTPEENAITQVDLRLVMEPNTARKLKVRKTNKIKDFVHVAGPLGVSHFLVLTCTDVGTYLRAIKVPHGPTVTFRLCSYSTTADVQLSQCKCRRIRPGPAGPILSPTSSATPGRAPPSPNLGPRTPGSARPSPASAAPRPPIHPPPTRSPYAVQTPRLDLRDRDLSYLPKELKDIDLKGCTAPWRLKTKICRRWMDTGYCEHGKDCWFAHGSHELRDTSEFSFVFFSLSANDATVA